MLSLGTRSSVGASGSMQRQVVITGEADSVNLSRDETSAEKAALRGLSRDGELPCSRSRGARLGIRGASSLRSDLSAVRRERGDSVRPQAGAEPRPGARPRRYQYGCDRAAFGDGGRKVRAASTGRIEDRGGG